MWLFKKDFVKQNFLFKYRTNITWSGLPNHLENFHYEIICAEKDSHCFTTSIRICMARDHGMQILHKDLKKLLMSEVSVNRAKYKNFYSGTFDDMLTSLETYLTYGVYSQEVVDIAVLAAAKVLCVNMCIYNKQYGKALLITQTSNPPSSCDVYLKYEKEHYDAICLMTPGQRKAIKRKPLNKNDIPPLPNVGDNDIPLECGFTQNQINAFALQGTFFKSYTHEGEKYLVMLMNLPNMKSPKASEISSMLSLSFMALTASL